MITLGNAAKQLGVSKPTISKAISKGQLSASKREDGSFAIDPSELMRWWQGVSHRFHPQPVSSFQAATPSDSTANGPTIDGDTELRIRNAQLEAELSGLKELLKVHRDQIGDLRTERDKLLSQVDSAHRLLTHQKPVGTGRGLMGWLRRPS